MFDVVLLREGARKSNTVVQGVVRVVLVKNTFFEKKLPEEFIQSVFVYHKQKHNHWLTRMVQASSRGTRNFGMLQIVFKSFSPKNL